jgi:hypothetical protein
MAYTGGKLYEYRGTQMTFGQLAAIAKVSYSVLSNRIHHLRWSIKDAVEKPRMTASEAGRKGKDTARRLHLLRG